MLGHESELADVMTPHAEPPLLAGPYSPVDRPEREAIEDEQLMVGATVARGAGTRAREEEPDHWRTCFERDRDRILHSSAFRRLAGKTQVFVFPADHQRTRLTHALEVSQVATAIARACRLNVALTEAIALGHDCGHGPGGHASEEAFDAFVDGGFDHAVWGADVTAAPLNLCAETLDGIRNHSWTRPAPSTPEGEAVAFADRIAYTAHDLEDAIHAGIVSFEDIPVHVVEWCGVTRSEQLRALISDVIVSTCNTGVVSLTAPAAEALAALRSFNYEHIYLRPASIEQSRRVIDMLQALVEHFARRPGEMPHEATLLTGDPVLNSVAYVAGMTDRYACSQAVARLDWSPDRLPRGAA
jgi:dGTPase